jgi:arylsulfatase A-like enzyme
MDEPPRRQVVAAIAAAALACACVMRAEAAAPHPPNVVLVLADDLGYGDVRSFNPAGRVATPHLDRLAREGVRFTDAHSGSAVCTPTRYGLLTGRYAWRTRLTSGVLWGEGAPLVEPGRVTIASLLKGRGYATAAIGKWHLGLGWEALPGRTPSTTTENQVEWIDYGRPVAGGPTTAGFDRFFGIPASLDMPPYVFVRDDRVERLPTVRLPGVPFSDPGFYRPGIAAPGFRVESVLGELTAEAVRYVRERSREAERPFFLYLALTSPHTPVVPGDAFAGRSGIGRYGDFVAETDAAVGAVLAALDEAGLAGRTIVIATSDNGPAPAGGIAEARRHGHDASGGFRGHKADLYEGGHRVPFVVRWPGVAPAGTTSTRLVGTTDVLATLADVVGTPLPAGSGEDSFSFAEALRDPARTPPREAGLVHHSVTGAFAVRQGKWKLLLAPGSGGWSDPRPGSPEEKGLPPTQLYDLESDPGESTNLVGEHPEVAARLAALLDGYRSAGRSAPSRGARTSFRPGELWPDDRGVHINAHGGGLLDVDGRYYWFGEHKVEGEAGNTAQVGVHCYSSSDLYNWKDEGIVLPVVRDDPDHDLAPGSVIERPKVVHNRRTGTFVMWFHLERKGAGYASARSGVAVADRVTGPYAYRGSFRPNAGSWPRNVSPGQKVKVPRAATYRYSGGELPEEPDRLNLVARDFEGGQMARDQTLFVDDDGTAYHVYASEENSTLHISRLTDDYLAPAGDWVRVFPGRFMEAPALFKHEGRYWLIASGCTGWAPNAARSAVADSIWGPWTELGNPAVGVGADLTFRSQGTFVLPVRGRPGAFVFMADRWRPENAIDGRYVWLPVRFRDGRVVLEWREEWDLGVFGR